MKTKLFFVLGIASLLMASCVADIEVVTPTPNPNGAIAINIDGSISQIYTTRVDDGGFCDGDQVGLFGVNYIDNNSTAGELLDEGNQVDNARYTFDEANYKWVSSGNIYYKDAETNIDIYAYYPYGHPDSVTEYAFEVAQDQSGANTEDGYAMSDFLWGKTENVTPSESKVKIKFNHKMACVSVVLTEGNGFAAGEWDAIEKNVLVMNTTRTSTIDLATGVVTATGKAPMEGIVMKNNAEGFRAIVVPQSVEAGKALLDITIDGISRRFKTETATTYEAGKQTKYSLKVNKKSHSGEYELVLTDTEIIDWIADLDTHGGEARQYYVVHCEEPGTLEAKILADKKNPAKITNLKVSGKINIADFYFMRDKMEILQSVNLKESTIDGAFVALCVINGEQIILTSSEDESSRLWDWIWETYPNCYEVRYTEWSPDNTIPRDAFSNKSTLTNFSFPEKVTKIGDNAFRDCSLLSGALIIPDDVTEIGEFAFHQCTNLTSLTLSIKLEKMGKGAFYKCSNLSGTLNLPATLSYIGGDIANSGAFVECYGFTGPLVLPSNLKHLGAYAFYRCAGFTGDLIIPEGVTVVEKGTFARCSGLNGRLILHDNITSITEDANAAIANWHGAFSECNFQGELKLPSNLKKIPQYCFNGNKFSSIAGFPDELLEIGNGAFESCSRLSGVLEFPESLISLGNSAFSGCNNLEGIILPSELGLLKSSAFSGCFYLNKIVCKSLEPPTITSDVFSGVAKDNFTVEVPEKSVNRYQEDRYWGEFKRIEAHYDFSIQRRQMRVLNAEHSRTLVLRAPSGQAWSVESCPEWVTVTPSSGVGKTEVTITVAEMGAGDVSKFTVASQIENSTAMQYKDYNGRGGDVVFLLNDKDYRSTFKVEQYDYAYGDGDVLVNQTASVGNGVNIVFMGDCFDAQDIATGKYLAGVEEAIGHYFDVEPYKTYKEYFNIYTIFGVSNDSGMGTVDTIRDAKFGSQYSLSGIAPNHATCYEYAMKAETVEASNLGQTLVVLIENTTDYGGICYMWGDGSAIACCPMSADAYPYDFRGIVQHEAGGHGFAKLADEYIYHNAFIESCSCNCCSHLDSFNAGKALGWYRNLEDTGDMDQVGWSHLIFHPTYSNIVDIYEGGYFHTRGIFRSEPNSCMNNNIPYFSAISRQEAVERIMRYAGEEFSLEEFYAKDVLDIQGNKARQFSAGEPTIHSMSGSAKQMPPKYMGESPLK